MNALVVEELKRAPAWREFEEPRAGNDEVVIEVAASALSNLVKAQANGTHYSSVAQFPFVPGVEGVGRIGDGTRVYFFAPRRPFGAMAERSVAQRKLTIALPDMLGDADAAALANPLMSSWAALTQRARLERGETVLVNGATGASGKLAVQVARRLGASRVIATGRDAATLASLGADRTLSLGGSDFASELREALRDVTVVLDYLWGPSAEAIIHAISALHLGRVRFVQIGSIAGHTISFPAAALRSTGLEVIGSGLGSVSDVALVECIGAGLQAASELGWRVDHETVPLREGEAAWNRNTGKQRLVFTR